MRRTILLIPIIFLVGFSLFLFIKGIQKSPIATNFYEFPEQIQNSTGELQNIPKYEMTVNHPASLIMGEVSHVNVIIHPVDSFTNNEITPISYSFQVYAESKLEIINTRIEPVGMIRLLLKDDQDSNFSWNIQTDQSSSLEGTLWIYLALKSKAVKSSNEIQPFFAIPMKIDVETILGTSAGLAVVIGISGCLIGLIATILTLRFYFHQKKTIKLKMI